MTDGRIPLPIDLILFSPLVAYIQDTLGRRVCKILIMPMVDPPINVAEVS
jgi:hypothetical protein